MKEQPQRPQPKRATPTPRLLGDEPLTSGREALTERNVDVRRFKALKAEVCISSAAGEIWLVPEYTQQAREELSVEDAAALVAVTRAFPDARVVAFERLKENPKKMPSRCPI